MNISRFTQKSVERYRTAKSLHMIRKSGNRTGTFAVQPSDHRGQPHFEADRENGDSEGAFCRTQQTGSDEAGEGSGRTDLYRKGFKSGADPMRRMRQNRWGANCIR